MVSSPGSSTMDSLEGALPAPQQGGDHRFLCLGGDHRSSFPADSQLTLLRDPT